jgi:CBS domain containing-hemolysin-like protein
MTFVFTNYLLYVVLIFIMMMLLFFLNGMEVSIITSNRIYLEYQFKAGNERAARSLMILDNIEDAFNMTLIATNIVNIAISAFITFVATEAYMVDEPRLFIVTAVEAIVLLIFCEIAPKVVARAKAESFLMHFSYPILVLIIVFKPAVKISLAAARVIKKMFNLPQTARATVGSREEIAVLFKIGEEEGVINEEHKQYVSEILTFKDITASEIMTPTIDIVSIEADQGIRAVADMIVKTKFSRIPIYKGEADNIIGYVFYRDILKRRHAKKISDIMNRVPYVPATKRIVELYSEMIENLIPMVFVVNEYGEVVGMVTHEDIAEEVVGEIQTRDQSEEELITELGRDRYLLSGRMDIEYFMRRFRVPVEKKGFETLSGFVASRMGRIPKKGDRFAYDKYTFIIEEATERSIEKIILQNRKKKGIIEQS